MSLTAGDHQAQLEEALRPWRAGFHTEAQGLYAATFVVQGERYTAARAAAFFRAQGKQPTPKRRPGG